MKKNKNGFTLIELLAVISIIILLTLLIYPVVNKVIDNNKQKLYNQQIIKLEKISEDWIIENMGVLTKTTNYILTLGELEEKHFIETADINNPKTGKKLTGCININWREEINQFYANYIEECS